MPQAIQATDAEGRWAIYFPLTLGGKIPASDADEIRREALLMKQLYRSPNGDRRGRIPLRYKREVRLKVPGYGRENPNKF